MEFASFDGRESESNMSAYKELAHIPITNCREYFLKVKKENSTKILLVNRQTTNSKKNCFTGSNLRQNKMSVTEQISTKNCK